MIRLFFGSPGSGKTTLAVRNFYKLQHKRNSPYDYYFANFDTDLAFKVNLKDLGKWTFPEYSYVIIDEAGIEYNNRKFKTLDQKTIEWFKLHRHYRCDVDVISQSWEDSDITIRRLADELWYIRKLGPFTLVRRVFKSVSVDENTHQIIDSFLLGKMIKRILPFPFHQKTWFLVFRPKYYKYFSSFAHPDTTVAYSAPQQFNRKQKQRKQPKILAKLRTLPYWQSFRRCIGKRLGRGYRKDHNRRRWNLFKNFFKFTIK